MAEFQYQGVDKDGKKVEGTLEAPSEGDLRMLLRSMGVRPTKITKPGIMQADLGMLVRGGGSVKSETLVAFTRQLQVLISSGIPLVQALEILGEQSSDRTMQTTISVIKEKVSAGTYLWEAVSGAPKIFPKLYIALVRAGESSGSLDQMLKRLTRYLEDAERLKRLVKGAMIYPIGVIIVGIAVVTMMLMFVIPKFETLLVSSGQELPMPTRVVINLSHFIGSNFIYLAAGFGAFGYLGFRYLRSPEGRAVKDRVLFKLPLFGALAQKAAVARFSRTMQTLLSSGVNLIDAIDICKATIDNSVLEEAVSGLRGEVEAGKTLGLVVSKMNVFPKMAAQMIGVGESTGNLDKMLEKVADYYEAEVEAMVSGLTKLIEPVILVFLGGAIGGLMIAMYLPIFKMAGGAGQ